MLKTNVNVKNMLKTYVKNMRVFNMPTLPGMANRLIIS